MSDNTPSPLYVTLSGLIDAEATRRVFDGLAHAVREGIKEVHLLIQSTGGSVGDGVAIYNYVRHLPFHITTYNCGTVSSIAVPIYLTGEVRKATEDATFMLHPSRLVSQRPMPGFDLLHLSKTAQVDDDRVDAIIKSHISMPDSQWEICGRTDLVITADEAMGYGLIHEFEAFRPPERAQLFSL